MAISRIGQLTLVIVALVVAGCASATGEDDDVQVRVVATTSILGDVVSNVVGDDASVEVLTPLGADPHDFQASAAQVARVHTADLVVANGLGLEEGLEDVLDAAADDGVRVIEVAPVVDPIPFGSHRGHGEQEGHEEHEEHEGHEGEDPHFWFDPLRVAEAARVIATELAATEPDVDWLSHAEAYADELADTDARIVEMLSGIGAGDRLLVTNHDSLGYFADRYDFEVIGVVIPGGSTLGGSSSEELAGLIEVMEHEGVRVIFAETTQPAALAETVASELGAGVDVVELFTGSLGEPGSGADTLIGMLLTNAERIAEAFGE